MPDIVLTADDLYDCASRIQLASWELLNRVMVARNQGAGVLEADARLIVALRAECMRHERFP